MKRQVLALIATVAALAGSSARAQALSGLWQLKGSETVIRFQPCGGALCGVLESSRRIQADPDARDDKNKDERLRSRRLKGLAMLEELKPAGGGWKGRVYRPSSGATYDVTVKQVDASTLSATGCAAPFLCQTYPLIRQR